MQTADEDLLDIDPFGLVADEPPWTLQDLAAIVRDELTRLGLGRLPDKKGWTRHAQ